MEEKKKFKKVRINFSINNKKPYGINVIGDPFNPNSYLVINLSVSFVKQLMFNKLENTDKENLDEVFRFYPKKEMIYPFRMNVLDIAGVNSILRDYPVPSLPTETPNKDVEFINRYHFIGNSKIKVISMEKYNFGKFIKELPNPITKSTNILLGIPNKYISMNNFDLDITLSKEVFESLLTLNYVTIGEPYSSKSF